jgi:hypothetical protein
MKIIIYILAIISLYIICSIGLDLFWKIGEFENAENINTVLIRISYSYVSGFIFYLLTNEIPHLLKKRKVQPVLTEKIELTYDLVESLLQTFISEKKENLLKNSNENFIKKLIENEPLKNESYFTKITFNKMTNSEFIIAQEEKLVKTIKDLLFYKEFLSSRQIYNLEKIKSAYLFTLVKALKYNSSKLIGFEKTDKFKSNFSKELNEMVESAKEIK